MLFALKQRQRDLTLAMVWGPITLLMFLKSVKLQSLIASSVPPTIKMCHNTKDPFPYATKEHQPREPPDEPH